MLFFKIKPFPNMFMLRLVKQLDFHREIKTDWVGEKRQTQRIERNGHHVHSGTKQNVVKHKYTRLFLLVHARALGLDIKPASSKAHIHLNSEKWHSKMNHRAVQRRLTTTKHRNQIKNEQHSKNWAGKPNCDDRLQQERRAKMGKNHEKNRQKFWNLEKQNRSLW